MGVPLCPTAVPLCPQGGHCVPIGEQCAPWVSHGCPTVPHRWPHGWPLCPHGWPVCPMGGQCVPTVAHGCPTVSHGCPTVSTRCPTVSLVCPAVSPGCPGCPRGARGVPGRAMGCPPCRVPTHLQDAALGVDIGDTEHDDGSAIVVHWGGTKWGVIRVLCHRVTASPRHRIPAPGRPSPKSMPSDTFPRATESRMAPRPFSQACRQPPCHRGGCHR